MTESEKIFHDVFMELVKEAFEELYNPVDLTEYNHMLSKINAAQRKFFSETEIEKQDNQVLH